MCSHYRPHSVALIGGGRWGHTLFSALECQLKDEERILWFSQHGVDAIIGKLAQRESLMKERKSNSGPNALAFSDPTALWAERPTCAIIVTSTNEHAVNANFALEKGVPTLVEKPMCLTESDGKNLLEKACSRHVPLGVNLEFLYASYLSEFASFFKKSKLNHIDITWKDPAREHRNGWKKHLDLSTHRCMDIYPHIWSLLTRIGKDRERSIEIHDLDVVIPTKDQMLPPDALLISGGSNQSWTFQATISRRAQKRERRIKATTSTGTWCLDFSNEPGIITKEGERVALEINWNRSRRPLGESLYNFLTITKESLDTWEAGARLCFAHLSGACQAEYLAKEAEFNFVSSALKKEGLDSDKRIGIFLAENILPEVSQNGLSLIARKCGEDQYEEQTFINNVIEWVVNKPENTTEELMNVLSSSSFLKSLK